MHCQRGSRGRCASTADEASEYSSRKHTVTAKASGQESPGNLNCNKQRPEPFTSGQVYYPNKKRLGEGFLSGHDCKSRRRRHFHVLCVFDPNDPSQMDEGARFSERTVQLALEMGGTCTGEHGIGVGKMKFMRQEHGDALDVMRTIKKALDPDNRMNPGKIVDMSAG